MARKPQPLDGGELSPSPTRDSSNKKVRVYVNNVEIPSIDEGVTTDVRTDGVSDLSKISHVHFPAVWRDVDVLSLIDTFKEDGEIAPVRIEARPPDSTAEADFQTIHSGWTNGTGSGGEGLKLRLRALDMDKFLTGIQFSETFERATAIDVIESIQERIGAKLPFQNDLPLAIPSDGEFTKTIEGTESRGRLRYAYEEILTPDPEDFPNFFSDASSITPKTFQANRDTALDALRWISKAVGGYFFLQYMDSLGKHVLVIDNDPIRQQYTDQTIDSKFPTVQTRLGGNNALFEIHPINSVQVYGRSPRSVQGLKIDQSSVPAREFPVATAQHTGLLKRAGGTVLQPPIVESDAYTIEGVENVAKRELKRRLDGATGGDIDIDGRPDMLPYSSIEAKPMDGERYGINVPSLKYEVERVRHHFPCTREYTDRDTQRYTTTVDVSMYSDNSDIEIPSSSTKQL